MHYRFAKALESVKQGEDMWVLLGSSNIYDAKARKVRCCTVRRGRTLKLLPVIYDKHML